MCLRYTFQVMIKYKSHHGDSADGRHGEKEGEKLLLLEQVRVTVSCWISRGFIFLYFHVTQ